MTEPIHHNRQVDEKQVEHNKTNKLDTLLPSKISEN